MCLLITSRVYHIDSTYTYTDTHTDTHTYMCTHAYIFDSLDIMENIMTFQ